MNVELSIEGLTKEEGLTDQNSEAQIILQLYVNL